MRTIVSRSIPFDGRRGGLRVTLVLDCGDTLTVAHSGAPSKAARCGRCLMRKRGMIE